MKQENRMRKTNAQPPETFTGIKKRQPDAVAAGYTALLTAMEHVAAEPGLGRGLKGLMKMNQKGGFDCPGCAWPDPDKHRSSLGEYCENGAKALAEEATRKKCDASFFKKYSVEQIASWSDYEIGRSGRVTEPMYLPQGASHYQAITWEEAYQLIGKQLNALPSPHDAIFYTSGRTSNEAAYLYQLFVRMFGTNNLPDCSNMCHESSGSALGATLGLGKGSVTLEDIEIAEVVMILGQNPGTNHPRMLSALQKTKANGGKIITINPLPEAGLIAFRNPQDPLHLLGGKAELTDIFLQVKINSDIFLLKAFMKLLLEAEATHPGKVVDTAFIDKYTTGYQELIADLQQYTVSELCAACGVDEQLVRAAATLLASKKKIIACWAMGLTQHKNSVYTIQEVVNLLLMRGAIGIPGAGTCPVRGHSNVQGDRTMGIYEKPKRSFLDGLKKAFDFEPPYEHGYDVVDAIKAMHAASNKVFIALGGNFLSATPDTEYTAQALRNCALTVHVSTKLNRSHVVHGKEALILPCLGRSEKDLQKTGYQFVSVENSMGIVSSSQGNLEPASTQLRSEPSIVANIAHATLGNKYGVEWLAFADNYDIIRDKIEASIAGFENYNQRVRIPEGFYLPNGPRVRDFSASPNGKANFTVNALPQLDLPKGNYRMMTIRTHDQFNTTIYGLNDRYRGIYNERRVVLINAKDMVEANLVENEVVDLVGMYDGVERRAERFLVVSYDIPQQQVATYFPEANVLVPVDSVAEISNTPTSKSVTISVVKRS